MFEVKSVKMHNFRNIVDSEILLSSDDFKNRFCGKTIGIYGQNGTSKSTVGYALSLLHKLSSGISISAFFHNFDDDFGINDDFMSLEYCFNYSKENIKEYNGIRLSFIFKKKPSTEDVFLAEEKISLCSKTSGRRHEYFVSYGDGSLFSKDTNDYRKLSDLFQCKQDVVSRLIMNSSSSNCSLFLNIFTIKNILEFYEKNSINISAEYDYIQNFAVLLIKNMVVIMPDSYGCSITNSLFIGYGDSTNPLTYIARDCVDNQIKVNEKQKNDMISVIKKSNAFLSKIIPGFYVRVDEKEISMASDEEKKFAIRLMSVKKDKKAFSFENESEGIKRMFFIASALARCTKETDYIVFVDEIDEGIFEVLLGEIVGVVYKMTKGQFIFTSHNLRPLEILPYKNFIFSTLNPLNRYVLLKNIKESNNLRDVYIRKIMYGGNQCDDLLLESNEFDIAEGLSHVVKS